MQQGYLRTIISAKKAFMKLVSWNVNGIRSAEKKGFLKWFESERADWVCLNEIKATPDQLSVFTREPKGYTSFWAPAKKPGYSGVAIYAKREPQEVHIGMGVPEFDDEGRVLQLEYPEFTLISAYFPNSQREAARLPYKLRFCDAMEKLCQKIRAKGKNVVLCGDFNIAHKEIDLKNPKSNQKNAGFLPEERAWMDRFVGKLGYIDTFRKFNDQPGHYTWWSYRPGVREKNVGWRIDYFATNPEFADRLSGAEHQAHVMGSDHCPVVLKLRK